MCVCVHESNKILTCLETPDLKILSLFAVLNSSVRGSFSAFTNSATPSAVTLLGIRRVSRASPACGDTKEQEIRSVS